MSSSKRHSPSQSASSRHGLPRSANKRTQVSACAMPTFSSVPPLARHSERATDVISSDGAPTRLQPPSKPELQMRSATVMARRGMAGS